MMGIYFSFLFKSLSVLQANRNPDYFPPLILSHYWLVFILVSQKQTFLLCCCFVVANKQLCVGWKVAQHRLWLPGERCAV